MPRETENFIQINNEKFLFKYKHCLEQRKTWSQEAKDRYPSKYPLIVEKDHKCQNLDDLMNPK